MVLVLHWQEYQKALEDADEKVQLANQMYELVSGCYKFVWRSLVPKSKFTKSVSQCDISDQPIRFWLFSVEADRISFSFSFLAPKNVFFYFSAFYFSAKKDARIFGVFYFSVQIWP